MAEIRLENVHKTFEAGGVVQIGRSMRSMQLPKGLREDAPPPPVQDVHALNGVDLLVADGTTMAIVGPSGCGKSTLLRVVAGLTDYNGTVMYNDRDVADVPVGERLIGMVFQSYALYPHFFGQGNLSFFFQVNRAPSAEAEERIRLTAEMMGFGFKELLRRKPGTLSGGQQQRLAIARALVRQPELFLFDEPLSNLDAKLRSRTRTEIKRLLHTFRITAIYVTHDQTEAMALGDQVAVMRAGRIEQVGSFHEIMHNPDNAFVAGFLGLPPMNLIGSTVEDGKVVIDDAHRFPLPPRIAGQVHSGQRLLLGIRPEAARIREEKDSEGGANGLIFTGTIDVVEPDFGRRQQTAYVSAGELTCNVTASQDVRLTPGYEIQVHFPEDALYFFDAESEARILAA
jgi:ABC-type sugar transport system ATPase subunit